MKVLLFFLVVFSFNASGQKLDLGKVTKLELLEKKHKKDSTAPATFLFKKGVINFSYTEKDGFSSTTVFKIKLKIYNTAGLKWADFRIPYYIGYKTLNDEYVEIVSAYTYNLEEDKIVKTRVTNEGKFKEKLNENWEVKSVTFPNVKIGSIIELEYKLKSENLSILPEFQFQYNIPVNFAELKTYIPEFYLYTGIRRGFLDLKINQAVESTSLTFQAKVGLTSISKSMQFRQISTDYKIVDVPALVEEDYVNNINNYYGKIEHELQAIRYPDQEPKQMATTWEAVAKSIYEDKDFNSAINQFDYFSNDAKAIINGVSSAEEKTKKVFNFVKNRMSWNNYYGYYPKRKMEDAYKERVGNVGEINLMLISMLRMTGIDANPVLVSTRDNGIALFPNRTLFNYVIAAVNLDEKTILLDATNKHSDFNVLPIRDLNLSGRLIKKDGSSAEIDLMPKSNSKDVVNIVANINEKGEISGKIREQHYDYNALVFRDKYNGISKESYIEKLEERDIGLSITEYDVQNKNDLALPIIENYSFTSNNSVEGISGKMYISPFLFFALTENPFKQDVRQYPVDFAFPNQDKFNISLIIPDGYTVETLPQSKSVSLPSNLGNFKYVISNNGSQVQLLFTLDINQAVIDSDYYEALKKFYKEIVNKQTEKIVLKKT